MIHSSVATPNPPIAMWGGGGKDMEKHIKHWIIVLESIRTDLK
jgi:hypothetical protein